MPTQHLHIAAPMSEQQLDKLIRGVVKGLGAATSPKNRKIRLIRDKNQKLISSEIVDVPMSEKQISEATRAIAIATAKEFLELQGAPKKRKVTWATDEDGTMLGAEITEE
jgi:hypothetical protein